MKEVTEQIKSWIESEPDASFSVFSHASHALRTDWDAVRELNDSIRSQQAELLPGTTKWPEDEWIIGDDGRGDLYLVSASGKYEGVSYYDHEARTIAPFQPSLRSFYEYCLKVDGSGHRVRAQFRESLLTYIEEKLKMKVTLKTKFFKGARISGPVAVKFMSDFGQDFGIDMSTFNSAGYGLGEGEDVGGLKQFIERFTGGGSHIRQFTIEHLVDVLLQKKWFDPVK